MCLNGKQFGVRLLWSIVYELLHFRFSTSLFAWFFSLTLSPFLCFPHTQWTCSSQMISSGFPICNALTGAGSSIALASRQRLAAPFHCLQCDTSIPCSCQSTEEKADYCQFQGGVTKRSGALATAAVSSQGTRPSKASEEPRVLPLHRLRDIRDTCCTRVMKHSHI